MENKIENLLGSSKYSKTYLDIINRAKLQDRRKLKKTNVDYIYYEQHHILPKSIYKEYGDKKLNKWNLVLLTAREHYICHALIWKHYKSTGRKNEMNKMAFAFKGMQYRHSNQQERYTSKLYSRSKVNMFHSQESIDKFTSSAQNNIDKNGLNSYQRSTIKGQITKSNDIDKNGLNTHQRAGKKTSLRWKEMSKEKIESLGKAVSLRWKNTPQIIKDDITKRRVYTLNNRTVKEKENSLNKRLWALNNTYIGDMLVIDSIKIKMKEIMNNSLEDESNYIECQHCNKSFHKTNYSLHHGDKCIEHPVYGSKNKENNMLQKDKMRAGKTEEQLEIERNRFKHKEMKTCIYCNKTMDSGNFAQYHDEKCFKNPNLTENEIKILRGYKRCKCHGKLIGYTAKKKHTF